MNRYFRAARAISPLIIAGLMVLPLVGCGSSTGPDSNAEVKLQGAGATFPNPLYQKWFSEYNKITPSAKFDYQSIGSGGGIKQISAKTVDFGGSDAPMKDEELKAAPGEILVSTLVRRLVEGWFELQPCEKSVPASTVVGLKPQRSPLALHGQRPLSRFVGRAREFALLAEFLGQVAEGRGHVVGMVGEPGVGKSRLLYEFQQQLGRDDTCPCSTARPVSGGPLPGVWECHPLSTSAGPPAVLLRHQAERQPRGNGRESPPGPADRRAGS